LIGLAASRSSTTTFCGAADAPHGQSQPQVEAAQQPSYRLGTFVIEVVRGGLVTAYDGSSMPSVVVIGQTVTRGRQRNKERWRPSATER
jgi:hypothetical protein